MQRCARRQRLGSLLLKPCPVARTGPLGVTGLVVKIKLVCAVEVHEQASFGAIAHTPAQQPPFPCLTCRRPSQKCPMPSSPDFLTFRRLVSVNSEYL